MDDIQQLNEMRQQISLLKEKLEKETIINDRMIRNAVKTRMGTINNNANIVYFAAAFVITFGSVVFYQLTHSWYFVIFTILMMIVSTGATYLVHRKVNKNDVNGDLLTVAKKMQWVRRQYSRWHYIGIPMIIVWLSWFFYEVTKIDDSTSSIALGGIIGGIIGGTIGFRMHLKVLKTCDEIVDQIMN